MNAVVTNHSEALTETSLTGQLLLDNPLLNKGSAFSQDERREFGLLGLLPIHSSTLEEQLARTVQLAFFLPAVVYMADAVGTQTETLAVRGLSVGVPIRRLRAGWDNAYLVQVLATGLT